MADRPLLPGEHTVLGFLAMRPMHGYEMAQHFSEAGLESVGPLEQSLLYTYLRNLEERGLVRWEERRVGNRPPRKLYELTPAGRAAVERWLREPVLRIREVRLDFLLKVFFLHELDPASERDLIGRQIRVCEDYHRRLSEESEGLSGFPRLVAGSKLSAATSTLDWLRSYALELDRHAEETRHASAPPVA